jgi:hypothetical protein
LIRSVDPFRDLRLLAVGAAVDVEPAVVRAVLGAAQVVGFDHQRVAFPVSNRVAVPERLRLTLRRQLASVHVDVAEAVVGLVLDDDLVRQLIDLARLRLLVELQESHRQAHRVWIVASLQREALLAQLRGPRGVRQAALDIAAGLEEGRHRRTRRVKGKRWRRRFE